MNLYPVEVWELPVESCFVRVTLSVSVWLVPLRTILDVTQEYYEDVGWDAETEDGKPLPDDYEQPTGDNLRGLMVANCDAEQWALECPWSRLRESATCESGSEEPPDDKLWAVDEANGTLEFVTTFTPDEQRTASPRVLWASTDPATWPEQARIK